MLIKKPADIRSSEITPHALYLRRREFIQSAAIVAAGALTAPFAGEAEAQVAGPGKLAKLPNIRKSRFSTTEKLNSYQDVTTYNNFYEFGTEKDDPARTSGSFQPRPWTVAVEGLVKSPTTLDLDALIKPHALEERIYRMRCVEAWSMVIPWVGIPLADVIKRLEPLPSAKFVEFQTLLAPQRMPGQRRAVLRWPYVEALRMDEATHPLAILAVGLYGEVLPNQNGAPLRLVVPWKYGFKGIKSIVRIRFVDAQPRNTWQISAPNEYGFYANVNPMVDHPRWSQRAERRLGEFRMRPTELFNGYGDQVASLYSGMNLRTNF
jgi:methionine sulfoxide reductase catalytic subunit